MKLKRIDSLRRLVIPKKICTKFNMKEYQELELTIEYGHICIKIFDSNDISKRPYVGIVRKLDSLNRIVIPAEYLKCLEITQYTLLSMDIVNDKIVISAL